MRRAIEIGDFRRMLIDESERLLHLAKDKADADSNRGFAKRTPTPLIKQFTNEEVVERIVDLAKHATSQHQQLADKATRRWMLPKWD